MDSALVHTWLMFKVVWEKARNYGSVGGGQDCWVGFFSFGHWVGEWKTKFCPQSLFSIPRLLSMQHMPVGLLSSSQLRWASLLLCSSGHNRRVQALAPGTEIDAEDAAASRRAGAAGSFCSGQSSWNQWGSFPWRFLRDTALPISRPPRSRDPVCSLSGKSQNQFHVSQWTASFPSISSLNVP